MCFRRAGWASLIVAIAVVASGAPGTLAQPGGAERGPTTLRVGTLETRGSMWHDLLVEMAETVSSVTGGDVRMEIVDGLPLTDDEHPEQDVVQQLARGDIDLALVTSRAWDEAGVTSLRALMAPFLITSDALAAAVATSDVADSMLADMTGAGFIGLAMWPDELRHPIAYACSRPAFLRPSDMAGLRVRAVPNADTYRLIEAFGAVPVFEGYGIDDGCALAGHEAGFKVALTPPNAIATGNVTFFPRMFILAGNSRVLGSLDEEQHSALRNGARAARDAAIERHVPEVNLAAVWCAAPGQSIVHADAAALIEWHRAAEPVIARLREDPEVAGYIASIEALAKRTDPTHGAAACAPADPSPETGAITSQTETAWGSGMWPDGVYRMELTREQAVETTVYDALLGVIGTNTLTIAGDTFRIDIGVPSSGEGCFGRAMQRDGLVHTEWAVTDICGGWADFRWRTEGDRLLLHVIDSNAVEIDRAWFESQPWIRID